MLTANKLIFVICIFAELADPAYSLACSCKKANDEIFFQKSDRVFIGTLSEVIDNGSFWRHVKWRAYRFLGIEPNEEMLTADYFGKTYSFSNLENLKGNNQRFLEITTGQGDEDCGAKFDTSVKDI